MYGFWFWLLAIIRLIATAFVYFVIGVIVAYAIRSPKNAEKPFSDTGTVFSNYTEHETDCTDGKAPTSEFESEVSTSVVFQSGFPMGSNEESFIESCVLVTVNRPRLFAISSRNKFTFGSDEIHMIQLIETFRDTRIEIFPWMISQDL